ncbi:MAG: hypothetical protein J6G98_05465 [Bacilli bacterium]|nr:hypothetical protein [Bacilli bacterium]
MKRLFKLLIALFILYILLEIIFNYFSKGYQSIYKVDDFKIMEKRVKRTKGEIDNYYFEISKDDSIFSFQTFDNISKNQNVIKSIKYFKNDDFECIFPVTKKDKAITDIICITNNKYYYYNSLVGVDNDLDRFAKSLSKYRTNYENSSEVLKSDSYITVYNNMDNISLGVENYKGLYIASKNGFTTNEFFTRDIYTKDISAFTSNYYIVADYKETFDFHNFYVIDLKTRKVSKIVSNNKISMYSFIQGVIDDTLYLLDTSNKMQYEIDLKSKTINIVGNEKNGVKIYKDGNWQNINIYDAINNKITFNSVNTIFENKEYARVDKAGNILSGYYYLYVKNNNKYDVYKVNVQNKDILIYLFTTDNIDNVLYSDDVVIYKDSNYIKLYSDLTGVKTLVKYDEVNFNKSLKIGITR